MKGMKEFIKEKSIGFFFTAGIALLSLVTLIVYAASYAGTENISWWAFAFLLAGLIGGASLTAFRRYGLAPVVVAVCNFIALLFFIYGIYYYVSVVMVGIDLETFAPEFFACAVLFVLTFALSVADVFLPQVKGQRLFGDYDGETKA